METDKLQGYFVALLEKKVNQTVLEEPSQIELLYLGTKDSEEIGSHNVVFWFNFGHLQVLKVQKQILKMFKISTK